MSASVFLYLLQRLDIQEQKAAVQGLRKQLRNENTRANDVDEQLMQLWEENLDLKLYLATVFRLLVAKKLVSAEELRQWVEAVDAEDGSGDGVFGGEILPDKTA